MDNDLNTTNVNPPLVFEGTEGCENEFDPRNFTLDPRMERVVGVPLLTNIRVGSPDKDDFFRVRDGDENYLPMVAILKFNPEKNRKGGIYLVHNGAVPTFRATPKLDSRMKVCNLYQCVTRSAVPFLWNLPQDDGSDKF